MTKTYLYAAALCAAASTALAQDSSLAGLQERIVGQWTSIAFEVRPTANPEGGAPTPTYLTRDFTYDADGGFEANITTYLDQACAAPLGTFLFAGELEWHGRNPAVAGAWSQDYVLNRSLTLTPRHAAFADRLNSMPPGSCGDGPYEVDVAIDILGVPCVLVTILEGNDFVVDHDMLYVPEDTPNMLFMGGKHVDGTGFYAPENRPTVGLQQPLVRVN